MRKERPDRELRDQYRYPGFTPGRNVEASPWDEEAKVLCLTRRSKKQFAVVARRFIEGGTIAAAAECEICRVEAPAYSFNLMCGA